jgi:mono/diheme cytochrome c family protein
MPADTTTTTQPVATDAQMIALGDSIFRGTAAGGICFTCHGPDAKGTQLAPDLTDQAWINVDGTRSSIRNVIADGIAIPKQYPAPMPAFGQMMTASQLDAVARYVYSLSHPSES